jgi:hypothetical protein
MTGLSAAILALLTTHPEGLTASQLTLHIRGRTPDRRDNSINCAMYRLKRDKRVDVVQDMRGAIYFLYGRARTCDLELVMRDWDITASAKLREEQLQVSEAE